MTEAAANSINIIDIVVPVAIVIISTLSAWKIAEYEVKKSSKQVTRTNYAILDNLGYRYFMALTNFVILDPTGKPMLADSYKDAYRKTLEDIYINMHTIVADPLISEKDNALNMALFQSAVALELAEKKSTPSPTTMITLGDFLFSPSGPWGIGRDFTDDEKDVQKQARDSWEKSKKARSTKST